MIHITRLNHVSLPVSSTRRALDFYSGILGLVVDDERPAFGFPGAWLDIGDGRQIHLLELPDACCEAAALAPGGRERHLALTVTDLDTVIRVLEASAIDYATSRSGRRALFCRDPDGNVIELVEE